MSLVVLLFACFEAAAPLPPAPAPAPSPSVPTPSGDPLLAEMARKPLVETRHGACRMSCRNIDRAEVEGVLATGTLDPSRTRTDGACPSHALHGTTRDGQRARVVLAACADETRIVTVIDLDTDWPCDCE